MPYSALTGIRNTSEIRPPPLSRLAIDIRYVGRKRPVFAAMCIDTGIVFFYGITDSTTQFFNRNAGVRNQGRKQHPTGKTFHFLSETQYIFQFCKKLRPARTIHLEGSEGIVCSSESRKCLTVNPLMYSLLLQLF